MTVGAALVGTMACSVIGGGAVKYQVEAPKGATVAIRVGENDRVMNWSNGGQYDAANDTVAWFDKKGGRLHVLVIGGDADAESRVYAANGAVSAAKCGKILP